MFAYSLAAEHRNRRSAFLEPVAENALVKARLRGAACHKPKPSCFYRRIRGEGDGAILEIIVKGERS